MTKQVEITHHFCPNCKKIMIPMNVNDDLFYVCRDPNCEQKIKVEDTLDMCVFSKSYSVIQTTSRQSEVRHDPTYPRIKKYCENCGEETLHVYHYSSHWSFNCTLQIFYICIDCGYESHKGGESITN